MRALTAKQYAEALYGAIQETAPKDHDKVLDSFVQVLVQNGAVGMHAEIEAEYRSLDLASSGVKEVSVTTVRGAKPNAQFVADLNKIIGSKVQVTQHVDEKLLGGVVIRAGDTLIDASLETQLRRLAQEMES